MNLTKDTDSLRSLVGIIQDEKSKVGRHVAIVEHDETDCSRARVWCAEIINETFSLDQ